MGQKIIYTDGKQMYEHRYIMEQHIGRKLKRNELIHHINGIQDDNRIENLQIVSAKEHIKIHSDMKKHTSKEKDGIGFYIEKEIIDKFKENIRKKALKQSEWFKQVLTEFNHQCELEKSKK